MSPAFPASEEACDQEDMASGDGNGPVPLLLVIWTAIPGNDLAPRAGVAHMVMLAPGQVTKDSGPNTCWDVCEE